ncbi:MAG: hypothetical protein WEB04_06730 [Dehalococcoidia bacterium]
MAPEREKVIQIARLADIDAFTQRFGAPQTSEPDEAALRAFVAERAESIGHGLVEEAAASDDVTDIESAESYLEDRLQTLSSVIDAEAASRVRAAFRGGTKAW